MFPEEREAVAGYSDFFEYPHGQTIVRELDTSPNGLWMIRSGTCEVVASLPNLGEQQIAFLSAGAIFGELSFFDPEPHSATVRVVTDTKTMHISLEKFERLRLTHPQVAYKLLRNMGRMIAQKLREMDQLKSRMRFELP